MITMCDNKIKDEKKPVIKGDVRTVNVGSVNLKPVKHEYQHDRMWISFPLIMESEVFGKTLPGDWIKVYPRVIQFSDGKYYSFRGTHSAIPEYGIKGDNVVYYREILVEKGEFLGMVKPC